MTIAALIPFAGSDPDRLAALDHVRRRLTEMVDVVVGQGSAGLWSKADAVIDGLSRTDATTLIIHDADVWCDRTWAAARLVEGGAPWAVPHGKVHRLTAEATAQVHAGARYSPDLLLDERPYRGHVGGGIVIVRRDVYEACPLDPRFTGWGQEDDSWGLALTTLHGGPQRGDAPLWHHWHTPQARQTRIVGSADGKALHARYKAAKGNPVAMGSLIAEATMHYFRPRHLTGMPV